MKIQSVLIPECSLLVDQYRNIGWNTAADDLARETEELRPVVVRLIRTNNLCRYIEAVLENLGSFLWRIFPFYETRDCASKIEHVLDRYSVRCECRISLAAQTCNLLPH